MTNSIEFLNAPIYQIGDSFVDRRSESSSSGRGPEYLSYSYDRWDQNSSSEYYQMGEHGPSSVVRREDFHYYADSETNIVEDVSSYASVTTYDSELRDIFIEDYSYNLYDWGDEERSSVTSYEYIEGSNKLISSFKTEYSSYNDYDDNFSDFRSDELTYTYDYTGLRDRDINGPWDYAQRWGVGSSVFTDSEGDTDNFIIYTKVTKTPRKQGESRQEMRIEIDEVTGIISHTYISEDQPGSNNTSYSRSDTNDWDLDGLVDSMSQYSQRSKGNNFKSTDLYKEDRDGDGQADYIRMTKERITKQGISKTEYTYDTQIAKRPILEIIKTVDTDGDGIPESEVENARFRTLGARHTTMGDHALTIEDVIYVPNQIVA